MIERTQPQDERWAAVDRYIGEKLSIGNELFDAVLAANAASGLPDIDVSPAQGRMLHLMARMVQARSVLEIGTLGGYSTIELASALPRHSTLITLEIDPHHADVARANIASAGFEDRVQVRVGPALESLEAMLHGNEGPFDLVFIDADKENNAAYLDYAVRLSRAGAAIIIDNVVREGVILEADSDDVRVQGTRKMFDAVAAHPLLSATVIQTVGVKKWDGFLLAVVK